METEKNNIGMYNILLQNNKKECCNNAQAVKPMEKHFKNKNKINIGKPTRQIPHK